MKYQGLVCVAIIMMLVDCSGNESGPPQSTAASVVISPDGLTLPVGLFGDLHAVARDSDQAVITGVTFHWSTINSTIATIDANGTVRGRAVGQTLAIATAEELADTVVVLVVDGLTLAVLPADTTIGLLETAPYTVIAIDGAGDTVPPPPVVWSSSDQSVGTIDTDGVASAVGVGNTNIVATAGLIASPPAILRVATETGPCNGIGTATGFEGSIAWGFKAVDLETDGGFLITADDNGNLHAALTVLSITPFLASWSGTLNGASSASATQKKVDGTNVSTYTSTSGVILPQPVIGLPKMTLIVDLQQCTYRVYSGASVATLLTDEQGNQTNSVDIIATVQFAGTVPADWRTAGIVHVNGPLGGHSTAYGALHPEENDLMPLGFAAELFTSADASVGEASGGFQMTEVP